MQEIQKIVVFEGAYEKIFTIMKEEGGSDGGVVVQVSAKIFPFASPCLNIYHIWKICLRSF